MYRLMIQRRNALMAETKKTLNVEDRQPEMVIKVSIQDSLNRLQFCPVCGKELTIYYEGDLARSCSEHGDFVITEVWSDGEVVFAYKMNPEESVASAEEGEPA